MQPTIPTARPALKLGYKASAEQFHPRRLLDLAIIAELPNIVFRYLPDSNVFFGVLGGTSILIVVGVALDTMRQMEAQLMMRSYEGFLK